VHARILATLGFVCLLAAPQGLSAQDDAPAAPYRQGFWIGFGLGPGHTQSACSRCGPLAAGDAWEGGTGLGMYIAAGGTPRPNLLVGGEINGYYRESSSTLGAETREREMVFATLSVVAQYYPVRDSRLFLKGAAGFGTYALLDRHRQPGWSQSRELVLENTIESPGWALQAGVGYDLLLTRRFALVPFANVVQVFAEGVEGSVFDEVVVGPSNPRYLQFGLGFQWY
jgi:hypothetical protein